LQQVLFGSKKRGAWKHVSLFKFLAELRNDKVDAAILQKFMSDDPMADDAPDENLLKAANRSARFADAKISPIIELTCEAFTNADGKPIPAFAFRVLSTPSKMAAVHMEAIGANFDWLVHAAHVDWAVRLRAIKLAEQQELDEFVQEFEYLIPKPVKVKITSKDMVVLFVYIRSFDGKWLRKQRSCSMMYFDGDKEAFKNGIGSLAKGIKKFFDDNHHPHEDEFAPDGDDEDDEDLPE
jgi:hypothetical protein